ncbi:MAG: OsmC family protein [Pseudomonadota bacterium]
MNTQTKIKAALDRAANMVEAKPSIGQRSYKSTATVGESLACAVREKEWRFASDTPEAMGGDNGAPSPSTLFRASVAGCVAMGIKMWAARLEVDITHIEVCFSTDVDARGQFGVSDDVAPGFERADMTIRASSGAAEEEVRKAIDTSLRYSPMIDVVKDRFPIETKIEINPVDQTREGVAA